MKRILFVCLGNICRSPTAHGVLETLTKQRGLSHLIQVDSAGTAAYHVGNPPDARSARVAKQQGYPLDHLRARQVERNDFQQFDYILAMDDANLMALQQLCPSDYAGYLGRFLEFTELKETEVPDPYYGGADGFEHVLALVVSAANGLLDHLQQELAKS
ncbi:low molecular weight protein-tyrosine-phosphatase [Pontibacter sp. JAM-7]|uniref:low molecular weight protein-tyrosine-phosphatase n=1 Tax=Pontibacter sp. JAM-7 TaxID=3366581 RepID=UPI003AF8559A